MYLLDVLIIIEGHKCQNESNKYIIKCVIKSLKLETNTNN